MSTPFNKELAKRQIAAGGGTVLRDLEKAQVFRGKVFLIADTHCRTKKYLLALAAGVPCVSHMWLNESCKSGRIPNFQDYILPAGESCEEDCIVEWHPNRYQIMAGIRVMVISSAKEVLETWRSILMAAGSDVVIQYSSTEIIKEKNFSFDCDVIVTDPSCPQSILRSARELSIPVVSAEWLYQCVINGRKVEYEGSHRYEWDYNGEHD
ncbi:TP53-binding protein 1-like [Apostichopus japonicus]